jgi:hypothetical protein
MEEHMSEEQQAPTPEQPAEPKNEQAASSQDAVEAKMLELIVPISKQFLDLAAKEREKLLDGKLDVLTVDTLLSMAIGRTLNMISGIRADVISKILVEEKQTPPSDETLHLRYMHESVNFVIGDMIEHLDGKRQLAAKKEESRLILPG